MRGGGRDVGENERRGLTRPGLSGRHDVEQLGVAEVRNAPDLLATRVVNSDLGADVALVVEFDGAERAAGGEEGVHLVPRDEALVVEGEDEGEGRGEGVEQSAERGEARTPGVEGGAAGADVLALAGGAVDGWKVPADEGLPDVVVAEVGVLVVGRVDIGGVGAGAEGMGGVDGVEVVGFAGAVGGAWEEARQAEFEGVQGAWGPGFEVGHLNAGGGVHAVGGFQERGEEHGTEVGVKLMVFYGLAHGEDAGAVFGVEEACVEAVGLGEGVGGMRR